MYVRSYILLLRSHPASSSHIIHAIPLKDISILTENYRADDKLVKDYGLVAGATLHLVLALRGGFL